MVRIQRREWTVYDGDAVLFHLADPSPAQLANVDAMIAVYAASLAPIETRSTAGPIDLSDVEMCRRRHVACVEMGGVPKECLWAQHGDAAILDRSELLRFIAQMAPEDAAADKRCLKCDAISPAPSPGECDYCGRALT